MAISKKRNGIPARKQSQYSVVGGKATPQLVSTRPDAPSNLPISVVYWGYWKANGTTFTVPGSAIASASTQVGVTAATGPIGPQTNIVANTVEAARSFLSAGSFLYSLKPQVGASGTVARTESTGQAPATKFSNSELIQGVSGITTAFKETGWTSEEIIKYFLTPGQLGYKQFPGLTPSIFIQAVQGIIDITSLFTKQNK
jgi:hypothetical protein